MGDIKVGDQVINPDGGYANVIGVFPQGVMDIYRVTFSDGSFTECTARSSLGSSLAVKEMER